MRICRSLSSAELGFALAAIVAACGQTNSRTEDAGGAAGSDGRESPSSGGSSNEQGTGGAQATAGGSAASSAAGRASTGGTSYAAAGATSTGGGAGGGGRSATGGAHTGGRAASTGGAHASGGSTAGGNGGEDSTAGSSDPGAVSTAGSNGEQAGSGAGGESGGSAGAGSSGSGAVARPSGNTGTGFFTRDGKLYDANGAPFRIKGVNTCHYDENWASCSNDCGIPNAHANVNRIGTPLWSSISDGTLRNLMDKMISQRVVPMPGVWYVDGSYSDESNVTCKEDSGPGSAFEKAVGQWVARAALFKPYEKYLLLNIANEWGPSDSAAWRDAYIDAVGRLRDAGYLCTLVVDAGGCGQDVNDIARYAQAVHDSDPQHNIVFSEHLYGMWGSGAGLQNWQTDLAEGLDRMAATGLPIVIGEFGPGRDIGPSPTPMTPGTIIEAADDRGFGWLAWAWDDDYGAGDNGFALSTRGGFSLTGERPTNGDYPDNADLTAFGNEVVLNPDYGTFGNAEPATIF
jgi:mannan endo-1,4-beta-mannosidase